MRCDAIRLHQVDMVASKDHSKNEGEPVTLGSSSRAYTSTVATGPRLFLDVAKSRKMSNVMGPAATAARKLGRSLVLEDRALGATGALCE